MSSRTTALRVDARDAYVLVLLRARAFALEARGTARVGAAQSRGARTPPPRDERTKRTAAAGKYVAVFDPLDGSSNVDAGIPTGTIFGIFEDKQDECDLTADDLDTCLETTLQPGNSLVASGYVLYSSATHLFMTLGAGTYGFTYDEHIGEFVLTHPCVEIPKRGKIYSCNEANRPYWDKPLQDYFEGLSTGTGESGTQYTSRYIGSMVGDVHRTLRLSRLRLPRRRQEQERQAPAALRGRADGVPRRAGRRRRDDGPRPHHGHRADERPPARPVHAWLRRRRQRAPRALLEDVALGGHLPALGIVAVLIYSWSLRFLSWLLRSVAERDRVRRRVHRSASLR